MATRQAERAAGCARSRGSLRRWASSRKPCVRLCQCSKRLPQAIYSQSRDRRKEQRYSRLISHNSIGKCRLSRLLLISACSHKLVYNMQEAVGMTVVADSSSTGSSKVR